MIDFVMSENSMGFHAPQEAMRILGDAINQCRLGQLSLHGAPAPSHNPPSIENVTPSPGPAAAPAKQSSEIGISLGVDEGIGAKSNSESNQKRRQ
jgi:nitrite reductase (cytochrome c-552)